MSVLDNLHPRPLTVNCSPNINSVVRKKKVKTLKHVLKPPEVFLSPNIYSTLMCVIDRWGLSCKRCENKAEFRHDKAQTDGEGSVAVATESSWTVYTLASRLRSRSNFIH